MDWKQKAKDILLALLEWFECVVDVINLLT